MIWFLGAMVAAIEVITRVPLYSCFLFACFGNTCLLFVEKFLNSRFLAKENTRKRVLALTSISNVVLHISFLLFVVFTKQVVPIPETLLFSINVDFFFLPELLAFLIMLTNIEMATVDLIRNARLLGTELKKKKVKAPHLVKVA